MKRVAWVYCAQVGAPPEIAQMLEEIRQESDLCNRHAVTTCLGVDPELDEFMVLILISLLLH